MENKKIKVTDLMPKAGKELIAYTGKEVITKVGAELIKNIITSMTREGLRVFRHGNSPPHNRNI
jgi:hypothetical protein